MPTLYKQLTNNNCNTKVLLFAYILQQLLDNNLIEMEAAHPQNQPVPSGPHTSTNISLGLSTYKG